MELTTPPVKGALEHQNAGAQKLPWVPGGSGCLGFRELVPPTSFSPPGENLNSTNHPSLYVCYVVASMPVSVYC